MASYELKMLSKQDENTGRLITHLFKVYEESNAKSGYIFCIGTA